MTLLAILAIPAKRIALTMSLCLALVASLMLQPGHASAATGPSRSAVMASGMLNAMNSERARHGLPGLQMNSNLILSASRHDLWMSRANSMSHQLPGELIFSSRITKAGYNWRAAGENIGWSSAMTMTSLYGLQRVMYNEVAPNNGHRLNILSRSYRQVGIAVQSDPRTHKLWFTQDFGLAG